jgi:exonuclease III
MNKQSIAVISGLVIVVLLVSMVFVLNIPTDNGTPEPTDTEPPVITVRSPGNNTELFGAVPIAFTAADESSIPRYEVYIDGVIRAAASSYNWNTGSVPDGPHNITVRARDTSINWGEATLFVQVNNSVVPDYEFENTFKVMAYNIEESGVDPDWKEVVKEENPDILMLVETGYFENNGNQLLMSAIQEFNDYFVNEEPYTGLCALNIDYPTSGEAILSRYPILEFIQIPTVDLDINRTHDVTHDFVDAVIDVNGTAVHFIGAHLKAGGGADNQQRRDLENQGIINYMDVLGEVPIVYLGDMNSYSPQDNVTNDADYGYGPLTMLVDPEDPTYGQYSSEVHNFTDVFRALNPDDIGYTYGHQYAPLLGRIDYIIVNSFFEDNLVNSTAGDTPHADTGADHYSIDLFLSWDGSGAVSIPPDSSYGTGELNPRLSQETAEDSYGRRVQSHVRCSRVPLEPQQPRRVQTDYQPRQHSLALASCSERNLDPRRRS